MNPSGTISDLPWSQSDTSVFELHPISHLLHVVLDRLGIGRLVPRHTHISLQTMSSPPQLVFF